MQPVDVDSLRLIRPRSIGVEQVGLWALEQLGRPALLAELGVNGALRTAAVGAIVGCLVQPASERATHRWLQERNGLGKLLGVRVHPWATAAQLAESIAYAVTV